MAKPKKSKKTKSIFTEQSNISGKNNIESEAPIVPEINESIFETPPKKCMPTLPNYFKSLQSTPIELENRDSRAVIELLGECLGISDYKSNIAAFWFLDTLALQILKYSTNFDGHHRSIFVSWLAGEMKIIQEQNPSREDFFSEMNELFCITSLKLSSGEPLFHWEVMFPRPNEDYANEDIKDISRHGSSSRKVNRLRKDTKSPRDARTSISSRDIEESEIEETYFQLEVPKIHPNEVLDAIIDASFDMYGSVSRYALIQAAFVDPVEIHTYVLPYALREPRKVKQPDFENSMTVNKKFTDGKQSKDSKEKKKTSSSKKKNVSEVNPPPPSLTEEEILFTKREYILPLMESIEAENMLQNSKK